MAVQIIKRWCLTLIDAPPPFGAFAFRQVHTTGHAARPMATDEVRLVDANACGVETRVESNHDDRLVLHTSIGWLHAKESEQHRRTWCVESKAQIGERTGLIAHTFDQNPCKVYCQVGLRYWIVCNHVHADRLTSIWPAAARRSDVAPSAGADCPCRAHRDAAVGSQQVAQTMSDTPVLPLSA